MRVFAEIRKSISAQHTQMEFPPQSSGAYHDSGGPFIQSLWAEHEKAHTIPASVSRGGIWSLRLTVMMKPAIGHILCVTRSTSQFLVHIRGEVFKAGNGCNGCEPESLSQIRGVFVNYAGITNSMAVPAPMYVRL